MIPVTIVEAVHGTPSVLAHEPTSCALGLANAASAATFTYQDNSAGARLFGSALLGLVAVARHKRA